MAEEALRSTSPRANFHRLTRLLMCGGVQLLRETFDSIHSPADLPLRLADPAIQAQLRGARLTQPERDCLNPSPGVYGRSNDFDITLIFKLFRTICGLTPPPGPRGWDVLPNGSDHSLVADLVRIKYYRNEIYGHRPTMEISDIDFIRLWEEISEALLRIATNISPAKRDEWEKSIDDLLRNPLMPDEERCIEELEIWYKQDMDIKDELVKLKEELREELRSQRPVVIVIQMDGAHGPNNPRDIDIWNVILSFQESVDLILRYLWSKLHLLVCNDEVGSLHITVECNSLQVLEGLWEDYRSGHLNSVAQVMLITPQVLEKLGLTEMKLKTFISKDQYEKVKKLLEASPGAEDKSEIQALPATVAKSISVGSTEPAYLAKSEPGLAGFKTDSLGRMADSEASNEATSGDTPFEQAPVTEELAWSICSEVGRDWRSLGVALGLESAFLDNIDTDIKESPEKAWKVLQKWMQEKGKEATMGILINALEKIERKDVVDKLHEMHKCLRCPNLEKEINDLKAERDTLKNKISQPEGMRAEDEQKREDTQTKDEIIRENNTKIADLERKNKIQLHHIENLEGINEYTRKKNERMVEQIGELKARKEESRLKLQVQTDPEELDQLKTHIGDLMSQIEELNKKVKSSESECKRLQEELKKCSNVPSPESEVGDSQNLTGFNTDSLGRMSDSEASNEATSSETPFEETPVTELQIFQICGEVDEQWRDLGTVLGIAPTSMDEIELHHNAPRERARKLLLHWINKEEKGTTIGILVNALKTIGKKDVVKKLGASSSEIPFEKTPITEVQIWSICDEVGVDWRDLGTVLGIASSFMDNIEADNGASRERARKLLRKWMTKEGKGATVGILIDALEEIERIDAIEKLLGTRFMKKRFSCARAQSENSQRKLEKYMKAATKDKDEMHRCLRCPNLKKEINDLKTERDTLKNKISQLEEMRVEDEKEKVKNRMDTKRKDGMIREKNTKIADLERTNKIQLEEIEDLKKTKENIKAKKRDLVEEKKKLEKQIGELKDENEELKLKLKVQIEKQIGELKAQKKELRLKLQVQTDLEELNKKLKSSESECKRLQEELKKYKNYIFLPTGNEFTGNCSGVICFLKRDASAKLHASRSSDGSGEASDILNHEKSAISGTAESANSWWSIDLGLSHRLVITHYSLRQGKRDGESALTDWELEGSHDGENWEKIKTIYNEEDPQFAAPPPFYTGTWSVEKGIAAFRFFRILQTGGNSSGKYGIYLSGIELFGVLLST